MALVSVVGATGRQGLAQVRQLLLAGHNVRALSRSPDPYLGDTNADIEKRQIDLYDPATYAAAFEGSDAVFYNHPLQAREDRATMVAKIGIASVEAGSKRFVWNTSSWIPDKPGESFTYANNTVAINALWRAGVPATVFGSVLFMDNLLTHWARPFIMNESRYVYPHKPDLGANWISLDDVGKIMIAAMDRPDFEGAWMNIGGPERILPPQVAQILSRVFGREIKYDPCTPAEFGDLLVDALGDSMPPENRAMFSAGICAFYEFNNNSPTKPFAVNFDYVQERLPEIEFETLEQWATRQDWSDSENRPAAG